MKALLGPLFNAAPSRADMPVPLVGRAANGFSSWIQRRDATVQLEAMGAVGTLFSIVHRTSNATAAVDWHLYRKAKSGKKDDRKEVTSHAALDLVNRPNRFTTRQEMLESGQQHVDLTGEAWLVVGRNPRVKLPLELWLVRPDRMSPIPSVDKYLSGYMYQSPDGEQVPLEISDVLMVRMPNPLDPYRGMGPVQAILTDIDSARYSAEWNRNFFINSAEPGGVIEVPTGLDDNQWQTMVTRWRESHQGVANAHRVAVIENGKWVPRTFSMRDMQFAELRNVSRDVIMEAFGISKFALGVLDDVNRASAEAAATWFARNLTVPRLERWKALFNNDLLPLYGAAGADLEFDYESPVPEDEEAEDRERTSKATATKTYMDAGYEPPPGTTIRVGDIELTYQGKQAPASPAGQPTLTALASGLLNPVEDHPGHADQKSHGRKRGQVRKELADAKTTGEVGKVLEAEFHRITGRSGFSADFTGSDLHIAKEHAEAVLRGLDRFPHTPVVRVATYDGRHAAGHLPGIRSRDVDQASHMYAVTTGTARGTTLHLNTRWSGAPDVYRTKIAADRAAGWHSGDGTPASVVHHHMGFSAAVGARALGSVERAAFKSADRADESTAFHLRQQVSGYAATGRDRLAGEAVADVLANGSKASRVSRDVVAAIDEATRGA